MADHVTEELGEFFDYVWRDTKGYVYLPVERGGKWTLFFFAWPRQRAGIVRHVLKHEAIGANVFYSPAIYSATRAIKGNVLCSHVLWVDFDGNAPEEWPEDVPEPTLKIQSSLDGHEHCYWLLSEPVEPEVVEERNRALAYHLGADTSGWDADQILRPPHTTNQKRGLPVQIKEWRR
jgi:hypothetical protein